MRLPSRETMLIIGLIIGLSGLLAFMYQRKLDLQPPPKETLHTYVYETGCLSAYINESFRLPEWRQGEFRERGLKYCHDSAKGFANWMEREGKRASR